MQHAGTGLTMTDHSVTRTCYLLMLSADWLVHVGQPVHTAGQIYLNVPAAERLCFVHGHICGDHTAARDPGGADDVTPALAQPRYGVD